MKEASENVLIPACDELLFKTYGLRKVENIMSCIALLSRIHYRTICFTFRPHLTKTCSSGVRSIRGYGIGTFVEIQLSGAEKVRKVQKCQFCIRLRKRTANVNYVVAFRLCS